MAVGTTNFGLVNGVMTIEKTQFIHPTMRTHAAPLPSYPHAMRYALTGSNNYSSFRQYLEESENTQQADTKKPQSDNNEKKTRDKLTAEDLYSSKQSAVLSHYRFQSDSANLVFFSAQAGIVNAGLSAHQIKLLKDADAAKRFQKYFGNLVAHVRFNCTGSTIKESSTLIFESNDCLKDRYILSFDDSGYSLCIETRTEQFANKLSSQSKAFESYFFKKTAHNLQIKISIIE